MSDPAYGNFMQESGPATISGLNNSTVYAVGVAAYDKVGNVGEVSNVACATPQAISDFFSIYRQEGGQAGGGCTVARPGEGAVAFAFAGMAMLGLGLASRRRALAAASRVKSSRGHR